MILIIIGLIILADAGTKYLAYHSFRLEEVPVIRNFLYFTYVENRGAAFGILQNQRWIFIVVTVVVMLALVLYLFIKKPEHKLLRSSVGLIIGGGIGNLLDRICLSYVIDFIDFRWIGFPVFNVADICVVCGACLLCIYILFFDSQNGGEEHGTNNIR